MRFQPGGKPQIVNWYEVPADRPVIPWPHAFGSRAFVTEDIAPGELGELDGPRKWRDCAIACRVPGSGLCGSEKDWQEGKAPIPFPAKADCCGKPLPGDCGGLAIGRIGFGGCHMESTCDIYSPFGAATPSATNVPVQFVSDLVAGRGTSPNNTVAWTHYIDVATGVTILDGCTRTAGLDTLNFFDGDEVRIPSGGAARYVVAWVTLCDTEGTTVKRCYLLRHSP